MKKAKLPSLVSILILTLITVIVWVSFDVYRLFHKAPTPVVPENVSASLTPSFDKEAIEEIESRIFINDSEIPDQVINSSKQQVDVVTIEASSSAGATTTQQ